MRPADRRTTPTVFEVVQRAVEICDPDGHDDALADFLQRFEDRDEPATALGAEQDRAFFEVAGAVQGDLPDAALTMAAAVATYLTFRRDEVGDPDDILRLAARAEFSGDVPEDVAAWLADSGVQV
jgi:hypothetical protein